MKRKKIYNSSSTEGFKEAKVINGNPNGIINFTDTNLPWAQSLWDLMMSYTWFPAEANMTIDANAYHTLTEAEKRAYDLCLAQLISNDSIQTNQLMDSLNRYVTAPLANALLARQSFEEALHAKSYAVMVEDIGANRGHIYELHTKDAYLKRKNDAVARMYETLNDGESSDVSDDDILKAYAANLILENLVFPGGFVTLWSMGSKMTASKTMIAFIERDESGTHVPLFHNLFRSSHRSVYGNERNPQLDAELREMIVDMCVEEKIWTKYASQGLLGFSDKAIDMYIEDKANDVCDHVGIPYIYEKTNGGPLMTIENKCSMLKGDKKTNFFEGKVGDYAMGSLSMDF